eukprot:319058-Amphidinium_carterae.1
MARRLTLFPEGAHLITLNAAWLVDLKSHVLRDYCIAQEEIQAMLVRLPLEVENVRKHPLSVTPAAQYLGLPATPIDTGIFENTLPLMHSFYVLARTKPTMLANPRVTGAGTHSGHATMQEIITKHATSFNMKSWVSELESRAQNVDPKTMIAQIAAIANNVTMSVTQTCQSRSPLPPRPNIRLD